MRAGLFLKLLDRRIPLIFLNVLIEWYSNLRYRVRWGDTVSDWFSIRAGVRQSGVLSPVVYCLYFDDLVEILSSMGIGCRLKDVSLNIVVR